MARNKRCPTKIEIAVHITQYNIIVPTKLFEQYININGVLGSIRLSLANEIDRDAMKRKQYTTCTASVVVNISAT